MQAETYFENIQSTILTKLHTAEKKIQVAVAWFTDKEIITQLEEIALRGVEIEIILADNDLNRNVDFTSLTNRGVNVLFFPVRGYGMMHHKFCVVDDKLVITGSYNWTVNARSNNGENIHIITDPNSIQQYIVKFEEFKKSNLRTALRKRGTGNSGI